MTSMTFVWKRKSGTRLDHHRVIFAQRLEVERPIVAGYRRPSEAFAETRSETGGERTDPVAELHVNRHPGGVPMPPKRVNASARKTRAPQPEPRPPPQRRPTAPQTMTSVSILTGKVREYVTCPLRTAGVSARTPNGIPRPIAATAAPFKNPRLSIPVSFQNPMLSVVQKSPFIRFSMAHLDPMRPAGQTGHRFLSRREDFGIGCKDNLIGDNWFC